MFRMHMVFFVAYIQVSHEMLGRTAGRACPLGTSQYWAHVGGVHVVGVLLTSLHLYPYSQSKSALAGWCVSKLGGRGGAAWNVCYLSFRMIWMLSRHVWFPAASIVFAVGTIHSVVSAPQQGSPHVAMQHAVRHAMGSCSCIHHHSSTAVSLLSHTLCAGGAQAPEA